MTGDQETTDSSSEARQFSLRRRFLALPTVISFGIAIAFIAFLLARFDIDLSTTWDHVASSQPGFLALAFFLYHLSFLVRGYRWRLLLRNVGTFREAGSEEPSLPSISTMLLLSWFANSVTWFRLGDAYRDTSSRSDARPVFPGRWERSRRSASWTSA